MSQKYIGLDINAAHCSYSDWLLLGLYLNWHTEMGQPYDPDMIFEELTSSN